MRLLVPTGVLLLLACSGAGVPEGPPPPGPPASGLPPLGQPQVPASAPTNEVPAEVQAWVDREVAAAEAAEAPPADPAARAVAIQAFLRDHPDVAAWEDAAAAILAAGAAPTVEAAWTRHQEDKKPKPPVVATVAGSPWRVLVIVGSSYATSEDWGFFTNDVTESMKGTPIATVWVAEGEYSVQVVREGAPVTTIDTTVHLGGIVGYLYAMEGKEPSFHQHDLPDSVVADAAAYFELPLVLTTVP